MKRKFILSLILIMVSLLSGCSGMNQEQQEESIRQEILKAYAAADSVVMLADLTYPGEGLSMKVRIEANRNGQGKIEFTEPEELKGFSFGVDENGAFLSQDGDAYYVSGDEKMLPLPLSNVLGILDISVYDSVDVKKDTTEFSYKDPEGKSGLETEIVNGSKSIKSITIQSGGKTACLNVTEFSFQ